MRRLKIGIETSCLKSIPRGIGIYTRSLLHALEGLEVHLFARKSPQIPFAGSLESLLRRYKGVDLLHFPEPKILYGLRPTCPFVLTIHDVMPLKFPSLFPTKHTLMMRYFLPRYLRQAARIICVSEATRRDLHEFFPKIHSTLVPCALPDIERNPDRKREPFFLYVGSFEPRKNLHRIFAAFERLRAAGHQNQLWIAGKGEGANRITCKLPSGVKLLGYVSEAQKQDLLERATALIWPSLYEGFGLPLLEAMASGTPIITSDRGACPETVGEAGLIVDPEDVEAIAQGLKALCSNPSLQSELRHKGLERAKHFSLPKMRRRLLTVYQSISNASLGSDPYKSI